MKKIKLLILAVITGSLILTMGGMSEKSQARKVVDENGKAITLLTNDKSNANEDISVEKIDTLKEITAHDWVDDNTILATQITKNTVVAATGEGTILRTVKLYDVNSKKEKNIFESSDKFQEPVLSPDKSLMLLVDGETGCCISDLEGNIKAKFNKPYIYAGDISQAYWINNKEIIMPCSGINGFYIINVDGTEKEIKDVEDNPFFQQAVKVGNKIYYRTILETTQEMKVYDIDSKETKPFMEEKHVLNFRISPDNKQFVVESYDENKDKCSLILTTLDGTNKEILVEDKFLSSSNWSPDGSKISYTVSGKLVGGSFIIDINTKKKSLISKSIFSTKKEEESSSVWSPSGKKLFVNMFDVKDNKMVDNAYIFNLK